MVFKSWGRGQPNRSHTSIDKCWETPHFGVFIVWTSLFPTYLVMYYINSFIKKNIYQMLNTIFKSAGDRLSMSSNSGQPVLPENHGNTFFLKRNLFFKLYQFKNTLSTFLKHLSNQFLNLKRFKNMKKPGYIFFYRFFRQLLSFWITTLKLPPYMKPVDNNFFWSKMAWTLLIKNSLNVNLLSSKFSGPLFFSKQKLKNTYK